MSLAACWDSGSGVQELLTHFQCAAQRCADRKRAPAGVLGQVQCHPLVCLLSSFASHAGNVAHAIHLLLVFFLQMVLAAHPGAVQVLLGLSASQQLSTADLQALLLQAIARATRVTSRLDAEDRSWHPEPYKQASEFLKQRDTVIQLLLAAQATRSYTSRDVSELLHACILHGVVSTASTLLQDPAGQNMNAEQLEQLLLTHLTQHAWQYRKEADLTQLLGLLLQHPAAARLDAAVSRVIVGRGVFAAPASSRKERKRLLGGMLCERRTSEDGKGEGVFDPVELLVGLPAVQQYDAAGLASVLAAAAEVPAACICAGSSS
jgi:hypothetical protein